MWERGWSSFWDLKSYFPESCSLPGDLAQGDEIFSSCRRRWQSGALPRQKQLMCAA